MFYRKLISYAIILTGIVIISIPSYNAFYSWYWQKQLFEQWETGDFFLDTRQAVDVTRSYADLNDVFGDDSGERPDEHADEFEDAQMIGIIEIDKIDLMLPIMNGANQSNLRKAAGLLEGTAMLGETGNAAIAAHRSYTYGRFFNRLDEMKIGDVISIQTRTNEYTYEVHDIKVVEPTDLSVLKQTEDESMITLITCTPIREATHRLIVHAVEIDTQQSGLSFHE